MKSNSCSRIAVVAGLAICVAFAASSHAAPPTTGELEQLYQRIEEDQKLSLSDKYEAKMQVVKSIAEVGSAYTEAFEKVQRYSMIMGQAGSTLDPKASEALRQFSQTVGENLEHRVFKTYGAVTTAEGYVSDGIKLVSDIDRIRKDPNLSPSARQTLQALRATGEALDLADKFNLLPPGVDAYGAAMKKMTEAVIQGAESVNTLKGGRFSSDEEKQVLKGLPPGDYVRTPLYDKGIPVVEDLYGKNQLYLQVEPGKWTEVTKKFDYNQVATVVQQHEFLYDGQLPTSREIVKYLVDEQARTKLADDAMGHADYKINKALQKDIAPDMPYAEFLDRKQQLRDQIERLGLTIPPESLGFRTMLKGEIEQKGSYDDELRRMTLTATPYAKEYLRYLNAGDPEKISLSRLGELLSPLHKGLDPDSQREFLQLLQREKTEQDRLARKHGKPKDGKKPEEKESDKALSEKLEKRAKELAEKGWKPPEKTDQEKAEEAKPVIPTEGTIELAIWSTADPEKRRVALTLEIADGKVTCKFPDIVVPGTNQNNAQTSEYRITTEYSGTLQENRIRGTCKTRWGEHTLKIFDDKTGKLVNDQIMSGSGDGSFSFEFRTDGTLLWETTQSSTHRVHWNVGTDGLGRTDIKHTSGPDTASGYGVWHMK